MVAKMIMRKIMAYSVLIRLALYSILGEGFRQLYAYREKGTRMGRRLESICEEGIKT